ncbi:ABC transporter permease [Halocalculus aciditolerans]|uniref:Sulfate ABC transporter permease n=1 Tax=Halocalculus aciditolerans TaxID=1383812 RepID=A0A830F1L0_9EURY|nr:iron ABC transporter permease [Halocalculus aciditolerans]GGL46180.1 sulfate ABC transporter permease [Halocalculus aciditolerans]
MKARTWRLAVGLPIAAALVVFFYYPVGALLASAVAPEDGPLLAPVVGVLTDPFYVGALAGAFADPLGVPAGLRAWANAGFPPVAFGIFGRTVTIATLGTLASVALGLPIAYVLARYEFPGRDVATSLTVVPFVLPAILVAVGFTASFGTHGTINALLAAAGLPTLDLAFTLPLVVLALAFYNAPLITRFVLAAYETADYRTVAVARTLGANRRRAALDALLPQLAPAFGASVLLAFIFNFMAFPIVLALGGLRLATVEVWLYALANNLKLTEAAGLAVVEAVVTLSLTYVYIRYERGQSAGSAGSPPPRRRVLGRPDRGRLAVGVVAVAALVMFVLPMASMVYASVRGAGGFTLSNYAFLASQTAGPGRTDPATAVVNSLLFAVGAAAVALPAGTAVALVTEREGRGRGVLGAVLMAPLAVSGVIVGLGLLRTLVFGVDVAGSRVVVAGPLAIVLAHAVGGYPFVARTVAPAIARVDDRTLEVARTLGAGRMRAFRDVALPVVLPALVAGAAFAFAISIGEFDATIILTQDPGSYTMPIAVEQYLGNRSTGPDLGPATAMGTVLLVVSAASFLVVERLGGRIEL